MGGLPVQVAQRFPELAGAGVTVLTAGWDCDAFAVGGRIVVKVPKHPAAEARLRWEAAILGLVRGQVSLPVPDLRLVEGELVWSWHPMLPGGHLVTAQYDTLPEAARDRLAGDLGRFLAQVHGTGLDAARAVGAAPLVPWRVAGEVLGRVQAVLPPEMQEAAARLVGDFTALPADPLGVVFGQFDGHGWNMAFDAEAQRLNGIYDFADSGLGPRHQDFIYAGLVSFDLMWRVVAVYRAVSGLAVDWQRVWLTAGMHRLWELGEAGGEGADYVERFGAWAGAATHLAAPPL